MDKWAVISMKLISSLRSIFTPLKNIKFVYVSIITISVAITMVGVAYLFGAFQTVYDIDPTPEPGSTAWAEPTARDTDGDGIPDIAEIGWFQTNPRKADTDGDNLPDGFELRYGLSPLAADDSSGDRDGDGLTEAEELALGTNPFATNTDGASDNVEAASNDDTISPRVAPIDWFEQPSDDHAVDTDGDQLSDWAEIVLFGTDPGNADTDGDLLFDGFEVRAGGRPTAPDPLFEDRDGDGLTTLTEMRLGTAPDIPDNPAILTDPTVLDSDQDGMPDAFERRYGLNPNAADDIHADWDGDGVNNLGELLHGLNPNNADTDSDGVDDFAALARAGKHPLSPPPPDRDGDGLADRDERRLFGTRSDTADSDGDLLPDGFEVAGGLDPVTPTPVSGDPDGDGVDNRRELIHGTHPTVADTDQDGVNDGVELDQGSDPTDDGDEGRPPPPERMVSVILRVGDQSGSHSERYNLIVGGVRHQAPEFGVVREDTYQFERGRSYPITILHTGSNQSSPDYDYTAAVISADPEVRIEVEDSDGILGVHGESSYFYAASKSATLRIPELEDTAAPETSDAPVPTEPEATVEDATIDDGKIRFVALIDEEEEPTDAIKIDHPFFIEINYSDGEAPAEWIDLSWGLTGRTRIAVQPLVASRGSSEGVARTNRITLKNPALPPTAERTHSPVETDALRGRYRIKHTDEALGDIAGAGVLTGAPLDASIELRRYGRSYLLNAVSATQDGDNVNLRFRGELPEAHRPPSRFVGGRLGEPEGRIVEVPPLADRITARASNTEALARIDGPFSHAIHVDLTLNGDKLTGRWSRRTADGEPLAEGRQEWRRADPAIEGVVILQNQTESNVLGPLYPYPFGRSEVSVSNQRRDLVIYGRNLPQNYGDALELESLNPQITYRVTSTLAGADAHDRLLFEQAWEKLGAVAEDRGPDAILIEARLKDGVLPGHQTFLLNGMPAYWTLEFGDSMANLNFVRATSESEFETITHAMTREHVRLRLRTAGQLPMDTIPLKLAKNGNEQLAGEIIAQRFGGSNSTTYLSSPIVLFTRGARDRSPPPLQNELALQVASGNRLLAVLAEPDRLRVAQPAAVEVITSPAQVGTLWKDALKRAAACHSDVSVQNWRTVGREKIDSISNVVVFALEWRSTPIRLQEQAAMILLRDTFAEMLGGVREEFAAIRRNDENVAKFLEYMRQHKDNDALPFNNVEIEFPDGTSGRYAYVHYPEIIDQHAGNMNDRQRERWAFEQTKAALTSFIGTIDTALSRANNAGNCDVEELLDITGVGFERVSGRLLPQLMMLREDGDRLYWEPDDLARAHVRGVSGLAAEVRAQQELASIDNTMIALSVAAVSVGAGAILGEGLLGLVVTLTIDAADIAFTLATEVPEFIDSRKELAFVTGAQSVVSAKRLDAAKRNKKSWLSLATSVAGSGIGGAFSAYRAASEATRIAAVGRGAKLFDRVAAGGFDVLSDAEKLDFQMFLINAKARQTNKARNLSDVERAAVGWVDDGARAAAASTAGKIVDGAPSRKTLELLNDAESRRVMEEASAALGDARFGRRQIERMLDAHRHGTPPYSQGELLRKMKLLTEKPPGGAGLTRQQARDLLHRGIMGNAQPRPSNFLQGRDKAFYNLHKNMTELSPEKRAELARLWRIAEQHTRGLRDNTVPLGMRGFDDAIAGEIAAGRLTPGHYNEIVDRIDNIVWEMFHNGRNPSGVRVQKLYQTLRDDLGQLGLSSKAVDRIHERATTLGKLKSNSLQTELFRGGRIDSYSPRNLDIERLPSDIRTRIPRDTYIDPAGDGVRTKRLTGDYEVDHVYPVSLIQNLPGFWRLDPQGRRMLLHLDGNLEALPARLNAEKYNKLADEWHASGNISKAYRDKLRNKQDRIEARMRRLITCMLQGNTPEECTARIH